MRVRPEPLDHCALEREPLGWISLKGRRTVVREHVFEGVIPNLERRYKETDSVVVREELAKYISNKTCPTCEGSRLREEARNVTVGGESIYKVSGKPLKEGLGFFQKLKLEGSRAQIADKIVPAGSTRARGLPASTDSASPPT